MVFPADVPPEAAWGSCTLVLKRAPSIFTLQYPPSVVTGPGISFLERKAWPLASLEGPLPQGGGAAPLSTPRSLPDPFL